MTNKLSIEYCKKLLKEGNLKQISPTLFEVLEHSVKIQTKKGRTLLICDCLNDTKFCVESPICIHKLMVLVFLIQKPLNKRLGEKISDYEGYEKVQKNIPVSALLDELRGLRGI